MDEAGVSSITLLPGIAIDRLPHLPRSRAAQFRLYAPPQKSAKCELEAPKAVHELLPPLRVSLLHANSVSPNR